MKQKKRYRRKTKGDGLVSDWPAGHPSPSALAKRAHYVGSAEHKAYPLDASFPFQPALRSDASKCDPAITRDEAERVLRIAIERRCVSAQFEGDFPRYAWARLSNRPYVARLINRDLGSYKGWPIEEVELPADHDEILTEEAWKSD